MIKVYSNNTEQLPIEQLPLSLRIMLAKYLQYLQVKNFAQQTLKIRKAGIELFILWCSDRAINLVTQVTRDHLNRYQIWLYERTTKQGRALAPQTRSNRLTSLRMFFQWLTRSNHIEHNPASELELPKLPQNLPHPFTQKEVELILSKIDLSTPAGIRNRVMLELCYSTGIRRHELLSLKIEDFDLSRGMLRIEQAKGGRQRVIPFGQRAQAWIEKYLEEARPLLVQGYDDSTMFLSVYGAKLSGSCFDRIVTKAIRSVGIERGASHLFRHTCATLMLEGGADIRFIQQMLGHQSLKNTQVYTLVTDNKLKEVHSKTHPAANLPKLSNNSSSNSSKSKAD